MTEIPQKTAAPRGTETLDWTDSTDLPTGEPKRSIIKTTDPDQYDIRVADFVA